MIACPFTLALLLLALARWITRRLRPASMTQCVTVAVDNVMTGHLLARAETVTLPQVASQDLCPSCSDAACLGDCGLDLSHLACYRCGVATCEDNTHIYLGVVLMHCLRCLSARCEGDCAQQANLAILERELTALGAPAPKPRPFTISLDDPCDPTLTHANSNAFHEAFILSQAGR